MMHSTLHRRDEGKVLLSVVRILLLLQRLDKLQYMLLLIQKYVITVCS